MGRAVEGSERPELSVLAEERRALFGQVELHLTAREFDILVRLAEHPGWVLSAEQLSEHDYVDGSSPFAVNVHVSHLRAKLAAAGAPDGLIETVRGTGWRLKREEPGRISAEQATELVGLCIAQARRFAAHVETEDAVAALNEALERLECAAMQPSRRARVRSAVLERRGAARSALQDYASAGGDYLEALEARPACDHLARARLHTRIAYVSLNGRGRGACDRALAQADAELEQATPCGRGWWRTWIEIRLQRAQTMCLTDLPVWEELDRESLGDVVEMYGTTAQKARHHLAIADTLFYEARWAASPAGLEHARRAVEYALQTHSTFLQALATGGLGSMLVFAGDYHQAEIRLRQARELSERCRDPVGIRAAVMFLSLAARLSCDVRSAERHTLELRSLVGAQPTMPEFDCTTSGQLAWVALKRGDLDEAARLSEEAIAAWEQDPSMSQSVWVMAWPAVSCALAVGDMERAVECATLMARPDQQALADGMDRRLARAVATFQRGGPDGAEAEVLLRELEVEARELGYA